MTDAMPDAGQLEKECLLPPTHVVELAVEVSQWSPCQSKRGVVIFSGTDIVTHGHNYKPSGFECDGSDTCKATCRIEAIHAEQRALLGAGMAARGCEMLHVKTVDGQLVPSSGPSCVQCSKLALAAGISAVWLYQAEGWRRYNTVNFHRLSLAASPSPVSAWQPIETLIGKFNESMQVHAQLSSNRDEPITKQEFSRGAAFVYARVILELEALKPVPPVPLSGEREK